jgi:putative addiction module killer protein
MIYEIETTEAFDGWLKKLRDRRAALAVLNRLDRAKLGNFGDAKPVGNGINEMRIFVGPGYRVYYVIRESTIILLLCGGDKSTQTQDIAKAKEMLKQLGGKYGD